MDAVRAISGAGAKGPACFLVEANGARLLFDLGYGPRPGLWPNVSGVGRIDAIVLSHGHADHAGGLALAARLGNPPVYATPAVIATLDTRLPTRPLALGGATAVCGLTLRTGRNGHAPGGVWLHADIGGGLLYTGDYSVESAVYAYDAPPEAEVVILDASYGMYDEPLAACIEALEPAFSAPAALFPVPLLGRGADLACHLASRGQPPRLGRTLRSALSAIAAAPDLHGLRPEAAGTLQRLTSEAPGIDSGLGGPCLAEPADCSRGESSELLAQWGHAPECPVVFTGYLPPGSPAERLTRSGRAHFRRWNVHPRLSDNVALVRRTRAKTVLPAFGDARHRPAWAQAFAPASVAIHETIRLR